MARLPTVTDVAARAGVSPQTVSNVLNTPSVVRPRTRERVQVAIDELQYRPHASARRLRTQKSSTLGVRLEPVLDGIAGAVLDRFLHALTAQADAFGLRVLLYTAADPADEIDQFRRLLDGADVDAFVLTASFHDDPRTEWLIEHGCSFVTFGRPWGLDDLNEPRHLWVDVDGRAGTFDATTYRLGQGDRRVGYLGWPSPSGTGDERDRGWREAMMAGSGLSSTEIDALHVVTSDGVDTGAAAMRELLAAPGVDAVVCASDSLALGATLASAGRISVTGFDNTPVASSVGFSSVEQPLDEVAAGVLDLLTNPPDPADPSRTPDLRHRLFRPRLVTRDHPVGAAPADR
ncbi:MAG: LacI family DNA-binding transcriptional regulator [Propionibacteriaceae bacterium]